MSIQDLNDFIKNQDVTFMRARQLKWKKKWWIFGWWVWTDIDSNKREEVWDNTKEYLGRPYDDFFIDPYKIYCSELVYKAYKGIGINLDYSRFYTGGFYTRKKLAEYLSTLINAGIGGDILGWLGIKTVDTLLNIIGPILLYPLTSQIIFSRELYLDSNSRIIYNYNDAKKY